MVTLGTGNHMEMNDHSKNKTRRESDSQIPWILVLTTIVFFLISSFSQVTSAPSPRLGDSIFITAQSGNKSRGMMKRQLEYSPYLSSQLCPDFCICDLSPLGKKRVTCTTTKMSEIPIFAMDPATNVIRIEGSAEIENDITIGRIFQNFYKLEQVTIKYSSLRAIGDSSFWPGTHLSDLDLSHNKIKVIRNTDFNGLVNLKSLNLSDNLLTEAPSAVFHYMSNLTRLILSRNKMTKLVPRLFFKVSKLEYLDISGNPFDPSYILSEETFQDVKDLKVLKVENCNLKRVSLVVYRELSNLKELYLNDNKLSLISSYEFTPLANLKLLYLDGNQIHNLRDHAFNGLRLIHLGLSRNSLTHLPTCAFCNLMLESLDLSSNKFSIFSPALLSPLSMTLSVLSINANHQLESPSASFSNLIHPLKRVQVIKAANVGIDDTMSTNTFNNLTYLTSIDLSSNRLSNVSSSWLRPLSHLETIDLSNNFLSGLQESVLDTFDSLASLKAIYLQRNPWNCRRCNIMPLMDWINSKSPPSYFNVCNRLGQVPGSSSSACITCMHPEHLAGKSLHLITEMDLEFCPDSTINLKLTSSTPSIGFTLAVALITCVITAMVVIAISIKFKHRAHYYTHEQESDLQIHATSGTFNQHNNNGIYNNTTQKAIPVNTSKSRSKVSKIVGFLSLKKRTKPSPVRLLNNGTIRRNVYCHTSDSMYSEHPNPQTIETIDDQMTELQKSDSPIGDNVSDEVSSSFNHYNTSPITCNTGTCMPTSTHIARKFRSLKSPFKTGGHFGAKSPFRSNFSAKSPFKCSSAHHAHHKQGRRRSSPSSCNSSSPFGGMSPETSPNGTIGRTCPRQDDDMRY